MNTPQLLCGIELETEGTDLEGVDQNYWLFHEEGTLRGPHVELVLANPTYLYRLGPALDELREYVNDYPMHLTPRGGLHVHVDVRSLTAKEIYSACLAYILLEKILYKISGNRVNNKFCVPVSQSRYVRDNISYLYSASHASVSLDDKLYSGLNLAAISKLGSLEFRMHKGTLDTEELYRWVEVLHNLVAIGSQLPPEDIIQAGQSFQSISKFITETLKLPGLSNTLTFVENGWREYDTKIMEQVHLRALQLSSH